MIHSVNRQGVIPQRIHHPASTQNVAVDVSDHPHVNCDDEADIRALSWLTAWVQEPDTLLSPEEMSAPAEASTEEIAAPTPAKPQPVESAPVRLTSFDPQSLLEL